MPKFIVPGTRRRRVLAACRDMKWPQNQLAKKMGVTWGSLNKTLKAEDVKLSTLKKLSRALGVSVGFLVDE